ncbi:MAG TPA: hypothetical protein VES42_22210 [Pilimelia sp.]|nr:hypothetical protein [Pilimelia sp.]
MGSIVTFLGLSTVNVAVVAAILLATELDRRTADEPGGCAGGAAAPAGIPGMAAAR